MAEREGLYIEPLEPVDRIYWGSVVAGMFTALSIFALLSVLGYALGFGFTYGPNRIGGYSIGGIIWGACSAFIGFGVGGFLAARWASLRGAGRAVAHGFLVWAVGVPVLLFGLGAGLDPLLRTSVTPTSGDVIHATVIPSEEATTQPPVTTRPMISVAWWMFFSLVAGIVAAVGAGFLAARLLERYQRHSMAKE